MRGSLASIFFRQAQNDIVLAQRCWLMALRNLETERTQGPGLEAIAESDIV